MNFKNRITETGTANPKQLKANTLNWRKHPEQQRKSMLDVLSNIGWIQDVVVNRTTGNIVDGHLRVESAIKNNESEIPVTYVELTEDEEKLALATFDPIAAMAERDDALLKQLLSSINTDMDISKIHDGYNQLMCSQRTTEELNAIPEVSKETKTQRDDMYKLGEHILLCGDSTSNDDVKRLLTMESDGVRAKFLFTSPPYSNMREYKGGDMSVSNICRFIPTYQPYVDYQVVNLGLQRVDNEIACYWDEYIRTAKECGYKFLAWNVWDKLSVGSIGMQKAFFPIRHEWIFVFGTEYYETNRTDEKVTAGTRRAPTTTRRQKDGSMKYSGTNPSSSNYKRMESVQAITSENGAIRKEHPATFPVELPKAYIESMSNPGDIVIEPFGGSGTTLIACEETGRRCRMMELAPEYCDVIINRWEKLTGKHAERI